MLTNELVWMRKESITYKIKFDESTDWFCKSYNPQDILEMYKKFPQRTPPSTHFKLEGHIRDSQLMLYDREVNLLRILSASSLGFSPRLLEENRKGLKIYMEYLPYGTFKEEFLKAGEDEQRQKELTSGMVDILINLHQRCNSDLNYITSTINTNGKRRLKTRSLEEKNQRLQDRIVLILQYFGKNIQQAWSTEKFNPEEKDFRRIRRKIKSFLKHKGIDLFKEIDEYNQRDQIIQEHEEAFVHGDFRPQNIFYIPQEEKKIKVCDFDKTRLGSGIEDLVPAIYNFYSYPFRKERENFSLELARNYFKSSGINDEQKLADKLAAVPTSWLTSNIDYWGVHCRMPWSEIIPFLPSPERSQVITTQDDGLKEKFMKETFVQSVNNFFGYYLYGEGQQIIQSSSPNNRELVNQQLLTIKKIFDVAGVDDIINEENSAQDRAVS